MAVAINVVDLLVYGLSQEDRRLIAEFVKSALKPTRSFLLESSDDAQIAADMWADIGREDVATLLRELTPT